MTKKEILKKVLEEYLLEGTEPTFKEKIVAMPKIIIQLNEPKDLGDETSPYFLKKNFKYMIKSTFADYTDYTTEKGFEFLCKVAEKGTTRLEIHKMYDIIRTAGTADWFIKYHGFSEDILDEYYLPYINVMCDEPEIYSDFKVFYEDFREIDYKIQWELIKKIKMFGVWGHKIGLNLGLINKYKSIFE